MSFYLTCAYAHIPPNVSSWAVSWSKGEIKETKVVAHTIVGNYGNDVEILTPTTPVPQNLTGKQGHYRCNQLQWGHTEVGRAFNPIGPVSLKEENTTQRQRHTRKGGHMPKEAETDWCIYINQEMPRTASKHQKLEEARNEFWLKTVT